MEWIKYRKLPVVIEAVKIDKPIEIETLEGVMKGNVGDYLIKDIAGELYPCRKEIFEIIYEKI